VHGKTKEARKNPISIAATIAYGSGYGRREKQQQRALLFQATL
jgi:hypothetical protein